MKYQIICDGDGEFGETLEVVEAFRFEPIGRHVVFYDGHNPTAYYTDVISVKLLKEETTKGLING